MKYSIAAIAALFIFCSAPAPSYAWKRESVGLEITAFCEANNVDDWSRQTICIDEQWEALKGISPPRGEYLRAPWQACKDRLASQYDFVALKRCFQSTLDAEAQKSPAERLSGYPLIARCQMGDVVLLVRQDDDLGADAIQIQWGEDDEHPMKGIQKDTGYYSESGRMWIDTVTGTFNGEKSDGKRTTYKIDCKIKD